ncbi:MAG: hypothetical protein GWO79_00310 [Actinobacteria bacterium]|nr:hypothetical protein [Actinomycetota bacterium]
MKLFTIAFLILTYLATSQPAYAYLDPGSGSFIFQLIVGAVLGGMFYLKTYFKKIKLFFGKFFKKGENTDEQE